MLRESKNRPNTLRKTVAHYGLKIKNQLTKIDFKERKIMKAIKKGYSLAELSVVVLIVSMVSYLVVPSLNHCFNDYLLRRLLPATASLIDACLKKNARFLLGVFFLALFQTGIY